MNRLWKGDDEKIYCIKCDKYTKFKTSYTLDKTLVLFIICDKCDSKDEKVFKKEEWTKILKIIYLIKNIEDYQINK